MTLTSLQKFVKIDVVLFGKNSAAELLDLIDDIRIRQSVNNTWIVHLKHKGEAIPNRVLNSIYSTVNSDPNGVLLEEFNVKYQTMMGRTLIAADYGYKSLWHIFYNHSDMISMCHTKDGLLLIAEKAPEPPSHPPGIPEPMTSRAFMTSAAQARPVMTSSAMSSSQRHVTQQDTTSLKAEAAAARPDHVGEEEIALGYRDFQYDDEDGNLVILFINSIYSPNEFYVWFAKNGPKDIMEDYKDLIRRLNLFYSSRANRGKHYIGKPFKRHRLCVFCDDKNNYHRCVVDVEPAMSSDIVAVRDIDTGIKCEVAASSLYRIANEFKRDKCFARRCFLSDVRPFNGSSWEAGCQEVFGQRQAEKMYFAKIMSITDQEVELDVIDTHGDEDRHFSEVLVYGGYGEHISQTNGIINNAPAPSTLNDSFHVEEEEEEEDDDWLNEWLADEDPPLVDNSHINFASLQVSDPQPAAPHPAVHPPTSHPPALTPMITNLWDAPLTDHSASSNSSSEFLKNLMQINRQR